MTGLHVEQLQKVAKILDRLNKTPFAKINSIMRKIFVTFYLCEGLMLNITESVQPLATA